MNALRGPANPIIFFATVPHVHARGDEPCGVVKGEVSNKKKECSWVPRRR